MDNNQIPRALSHDERHAADAAFSGRPPNPRWSARAKAVYEGILKSLPTPKASAEQPEPLIQHQESSAATSPLFEQPADSGISAPISLQQAIDAGALVDVTATAKQVGLSFPVTMTKPLWETGIEAGKTLTDEERNARLRDVLMAFRLRLTVQPTTAPLIDFPALLGFPHGAVPQLVPLFALVQPDERNQAMVTLLLPTEIATTIVPLN
ncbi:MAG TPA: DUF6573 family protein [Nitrospira sp.]|nr:DUF6573 family protein [Nitrospira sp.]